MVGSLLHSSPTLQVFKHVYTDSHKEQTAAGYGLQKRMAFGPNVRMLANAQITSRNVAIMSTAGSPLHFWFGTATFQHLKQWMQAGDEELSSYDSWSASSIASHPFLMQETEGVWVCRVSGPQGC